MDDFISSNQRWDESQVEAGRADFLTTLETVAAAFGDHAFKRWVPERGHWRQQVLAALFDAEMFACRGLRRENLYGKRAELIEALKELFSNPDFRRAIDAATNTPQLFQYRIERMKQMIADVLSR